ncbi:hypothetical protein SISSUDRAFT_1131649 [Sistotremastrum suecicum HHB10207 ss-3]|uniref:Uncharacterized protein n=1 Tax=Sistotremastrum suecicum HHB10207 ss-3 TaxID=1314776 RepID=A0A165ZWB0_9AGAM|nr:hypothetical protein SISSUDRAFT_1131649 [Sistotremastrum suecicum HHB10207 ss-3]
MAPIDVEHATPDGPSPPHFHICHALARGKIKTMSLLKKISLFTKGELGLPSGTEEKSASGKKNFKLTNLWRSRLAPGSGIFIDLKSRTKYDGSIEARVKEQPESLTIFPGSAKSHPLISNKRNRKMVRDALKRKPVPENTAPTFPATTSEFLGRKYPRQSFRPRSEVTTLFEDPGFLQMFEEFLGEPVGPCIGIPSNKSRLETTLQR